MKPYLLGAALSLVAASLCTAAEHHAHWDYTDPSGPDHWADLAPENHLCRSGARQSPIDIHDVVEADLAPLTFDYPASAARVLNNGHTIEVTPSNTGRVTLASGNYSLVQFHFHSSSEEKIRGKAYPLVAHLVHRNSSGELAVIALLFEVGAQNPALAPLLAAMRDEAGASQNLDHLNLAHLLPAKRDYFAYIGSLTTPPCSEGVRWHVLTTPVSLSETQLNAFRALYPMNARPVQPLNGRTVHLGG